MMSNADASDKGYSKSYESDDEIRIDFQGASAQNIKCDPRISHGIVISGEAPESDDDIDTKPASKMPSSSSDYCLSDSWKKQWSDGSESGDSSRDECLKHNTLLHKKLRERNQSLRKSVMELACQPYQSASKEIHCISQQLIKSQLLVQEVTSTLRRLTNELFTLEDKVQSMKNGVFLPEIDINIDAIPQLNTP